MHHGTHYFLLNNNNNNNNNNNFFIIMTRIFTIFTEIDIQIKLKMLDNSNSANPQVAWANLGGPHLYLH